MSGIRFDIEIPTCREGVFVPCGFAAPEIVECVKLAEGLGYEAVWATDFLSPTPESGVSVTERPSWFEPMITLAYAAAQTSRIRLGTGIIILPYRDPVILAKQAATLDRLSKGRFLLGLGLGAWRAEFQAVAAWRGRAHRGNMAAEFTEVLRLLPSIARADSGSIVHCEDWISTDRSRPTGSALPRRWPRRSAPWRSRASITSTCCTSSAIRSRSDSIRCGCSWKMSCRASADRSAARLHLYPDSNRTLR